MHSTCLSGGARLSTTRVGGLELRTIADLSVAWSAKITSMLATVINKEVVGIETSFLSC